MLFFLIFATQDEIYETWHEWLSCILPRCGRDGNHRSRFGNSLQTSHRGMSSFSLALSDRMEGVLLGMHLIRNRSRIRRPIRIKSYHSHPQHDRTRYRVRGPSIIAATYLCTPGEDHLAPADIFRCAPLVPQRAGTQSSAERPYAGWSHACPTTCGCGSCSATGAADICAVAICLPQGPLLDNVWERSLRGYQPRSHDLIRPDVFGGGRWATRHWRLASYVKRLH